MTEYAPGTKPETPKDRAVRAAGGVTRLSEALGVTRSAVSQWPRVPAERVLKVEELTKVPRHELRPDIYPPPEKEKAAKPVPEQESAA
jgi:DNA-binding transcriptional regulator YdaS (Cro superfamily)